jgi:hypothetical protein
MAIYPEVLPEQAYAMLVRGDSIRVVDANEHELAVLFPNDDGGEFRMAYTKSGRRWKLDPPRDEWLVKR